MKRPTVAFICQSYEAFAVTIWLCYSTAWQSRLLWDRDWEMELALDAHPDVSRPRRSIVGIERDSFVSQSAPEPSDDEADRPLAALRSLTRAARQPRRPVSGSAASPCCVSSQTT